MLMNTVIKNLLMPSISYLYMVKKKVGIERV